MSIKSSEYSKGYEAGWDDALASVLASLKGYPDLGGDVEIMAEVDELIRKALTKE